MATTENKTPKAASTKPTTTPTAKPAAKPLAKQTDGGFDVRKTIADAGYIAVGLGVLSIQQAQTRRQRLTEQINTATDKITSRAKKRGEQLQSLSSKLSERVGEFRPSSRVGDFGTRMGEVRSRVESARERANEIGEQTRGRVAPVIDQIETRVKDLPTPLPQAAAPMVKAAKQLISKQLISA